MIDWKIRTGAGPDSSKRQNPTSSSTSGRPRSRSRVSAPLLYCHRSLSPELLSRLSSCSFVDDCSISPRQSLRGAATQPPAPSQIEQTGQSSSCSTTQLPALQTEMTVQGSPSSQRVPSG